MAASKDEDDNISFCSFSGEAYASTRRKNRRPHSVHHTLERMSHSLATATVDGLDMKEDKRWNKNFHHFRFVVAMMSGISIGSMLFIRYSISVGILKMVNMTALYLKEHPDKTVDDFLEEGYTLGGEFEWDNKIQQIIMSWYMFAYTIPQVAMTKVGLVTGARLAIPLSLAVCLISNALIPPFAYLGWQWVLVLRLINGVGGSAIIPMMLTIVESWMGPDEMSLGLTYAQIAQATLTAANPLVSGYLSHLHWTYTFYVPSAVTAVFCIFWLILVTDSPERSWILSQKEYDYIVNTERISMQKNNSNTVKNQHDNNNSNQIKRNKKKAISWIDILKLPTFYLYLCIWCTYCSTYSSFNFALPAYLRQFLKIRIVENGSYCSLIGSGCVIAVIWPHPCLRLLQKSFNLSLTAARRIIYGVVSTVVAFTFFYIAAFHDSQLILLFINRAFVGTNDILVTGTIMSNFAEAGATGLAFSMVNTVANLFVVFTSTLLGAHLDKTDQSVEGWTTIINVGGIFCILMMVMYCFGIRSEPIRFKKQEIVEVGTESTPENNDGTLGNVTIKQN